MIKAKALAGLFMTVLSLFALSTSTALAQWLGSEEKETTTGMEGKGFAGTGEFTYPGKPNNSIVSCVKAEGKWSVTKLPATSVVLTISAWNGCTFALGSNKGTAEVKCKTLELNQPTKEGTVSGTATGAAPEECVITAPGLCTVTTAKQSGLKTVGLVKSGSNQEDNVKISGISAKASGACLLAGLPASTTAAELKIPKLLLEGIGLV